MRIFEVLLKNLIKDICDLVNLGNEKEPDLDKHLNIKKWIDFLQDDANINVSPHSFDKDGHAGITREFTGGEILKILCDWNRKKFSKYWICWKKKWNLEISIIYNEWLANKQ